jgi:hypothetical protein
VVIADAEIAAVRKLLTGGYICRKENASAFGLHGAVDRIEIELEAIKYGRRRSDLVRGKAEGEGIEGLNLKRFEKRRHTVI